MATMKEIGNRADVIFKEMYSVEDILKGNTIDMHSEAWSRARYDLEGGTDGDMDKVLLGTLLDITVTEIYHSGEDVELYTEGSKVKVMSLRDIIVLYQKEIARAGKIDIPVVGLDIEVFSDVILENKVVYKFLPDHSGRMVEVAFMTKDEYEQRKV